MPGFKIGPVGEPVESNLKPYYSYTWDILYLFGEDARTGATVFSKDCTLPTFTVNREEVEGASVIYKYASMVNWEDIRISFYDIPREGKKLYKTLKKWRDSVWTPDGGLKFADGDDFHSGYKQDTILRSFNLDASDGYEWTLFGSWPQTVRESDLTYTRSDVKFVEVVISYDWADSEIAIGLDDLKGSDVYTSDSE